MTGDDMFGMNRESRIGRSGVRKVFTPHRPIQSVNLFFGRQKEVQKLLEQINTPGQHALLYGERGVGKSSLANIATQLLISKIISGRLYPKQCDSSDTFRSVVAPVLVDFGVEVDLDSQTKSHKQHGWAGLKIPLAEAGVGSEKTTSNTYRPRAFTPSVVAEFLRDKLGLLYVDEADRIQSPEDKIALAEFIKLLSDNGSDFKIIIVGVAETAEELTGGHPSVQRCLKETYLRRMSDDELEMIISEGARQTNLNFAPSVVTQIVMLSSGYPHFTHLLALKCAEEAISSSLHVIDPDCLVRAIHLAVEDADSTLRRTYNEATRSYNTQMYCTVLKAAAQLGREEFTASSLREKIEEMTKGSISQGSLNNYLQRLVSDDFSAILHRCSKGVYRFSDPRMPSFICMANPDDFAGESPTIGSLGCQPTSRKR
ncbi:MAG: AAA family ATPase [Verrucomicrobiota bacterium]|jgi:energy-coupling factor transporter ATP-binding protein EcfA2